MKRNIPPDIPSATTKPFQKSVRKSLFILFVIDMSLIIHHYFILLIPCIKSL
jgi:hypothetical protein